MKAKKVFETVNKFERSGNVKQAAKLGWEGRVREFLESVVAEINWNIENGYESFFNTGEYQYVFFNTGEYQYEDKPELLKTYRYWVDHWEDYLPMMRELGIDVEGTPFYEETVFWKQYFI